MGMADRINEIGWRLSIRRVELISEEGLYHIYQGCSLLTCQYYKGDS
jgi:hypothetical protein